MQGDGLCQCGCGGATTVARWSAARHGDVRGVPRKWIKGHDKRGTGKPGRHTHRHVTVAEQVFGRPLPAGAVVHHVNGNPSDNRNCNLVICQDTAYHGLLHVRTRSLEATGRPDLIRCRYCSKFDAPDNLYKRERNGKVTHSWHRECANNAMRKWRAREHAA